MPEDFWGEDFWGEDDVSGMMARSRERGLKLLYAEEDARLEVAELKGERVVGLLDWLEGLAVVKALRG